MVKPLHELDLLFHTLKSYFKEQQRYKEI